MSNVRVWGLAAGIISVGLGVGGCRKVEAKVPAPPVVLALETPEPPGRLVIPVAAEPPPAPAEKPAPAGPVRPVLTRPPAAGGPPTPPPDPTPPPVLQTGSSLAELEARAREGLDRARRDIARVSPGTLAPNAREQYDSAQRFIRMATDAITTKNFVYAAYCADKAATLAGLLVK